VQLGQVVPRRWAKRRPGQQPKQQASRQNRERELCPFLFIFLNLKFSFKKTILKLFDL
jgi:hypothetical protein